MSATKIDQKITSFRVIRPEDEAASDLAAASASRPPAPLQMGEDIGRPEVLRGTTYKIATPLSDSSLFITINDMVLNSGTIHEQHRPFEIFVNSKNMDHFQWIVALTRVISAVFRKGGDCTFLVEELKAVFDPTGGYLKKGGKFMPSLVAEIGDCLETHLKSIGLIEDQQLELYQQAHLQEKKAEFESLHGLEPSEEHNFPEGAQLCRKCHTMAAVRLDNCLTCLNCGDSKCG